MQKDLTVKESDIPPKSTTQCSIIKITDDICPRVHTPIEKIQDKLIKNIENMRSSPDKRTQEAIDKFKNIARLYTTHDESEIKTTILEDKELMSYINAMVVKSMDEYLQEKDLIIEDLEKEARIQRIQKYLTMLGSGCITFVSLVVPIVVAALQCD